jgi:4-alpha-glucanotransferase
MPSARKSGILLHPTSLPGRFGIGDLGPSAHAFVDRLAAARQQLWQVLPLGPTGYGDSPYQCFSAFAGNPLLISLESLRDEGLLQPGELQQAPAFGAEEVDYGAVIDFKLPLLARAHERFQAGAPAPQREACEAFCAAQASWLDDYALFMAVKAEHRGVAWTDWDPAIAAREPEAIAGWGRRCAVQVEAQKFWQFEFFRQWRSLRDHCRASGVAIMGDVPIFVAHDSADVWARRELFHLDAGGHPTAVAGVPPDYFSATGQLWGNPLYRWGVLAASGYDWWIERLRAALALVDLVRLDHFRGFEAYWEIPAGETTAVNGRWVEAPGRELFQALRNALGELPIVAEDLGVITPGVDALRREFGLPGMAILQFAFGSDPQASDFIPHNLERDRVIYTGTHDNDTTAGWWTSAGAGDSTRTAEQVASERAFALEYLKSDGTQIHWDFIRAVLASVAAVAIVPLQDVLGLGSAARMNLPGRPGGNWRWRCAEGAFTPELQERLARLTEVYGRAPSGSRAVEE